MSNVGKSKISLKVEVRKDVVVFQFDADNDDVDMALD